MTSTPAHDPYAVLELARSASLEDARNAYLRLVRENPPDRNPERFREVHSAWQSFSDPLTQARHLIRPNHDLPSLTAIIEEAEKTKPRLPYSFLLSLGNQD